MDIVNLPAGPAGTHPNPGKANAHGDTGSGFKDAMQAAHDPQRAAPDRPGQNLTPAAQSKPAGRPGAHGRDDKPGDVRRDKKLDHGDRRDEGIAYPDPLLAGLTHVGTLVASDPAKAGTALSAAGITGAHASHRNAASLTRDAQASATPGPASNRGRGLPFAQVLQGAPGAPTPDAAGTAQVNGAGPAFMLGKPGTPDPDGATNGQPKSARTRAAAEAATAKTDALAAHDATTRHAGTGQERAAPLPMSGDATQFFNTLASAQGDSGAAIPSLHGFSHASTLAGSPTGSGGTLPTLALLQAPVGSAPWQQELSAQVLRFVQQGTQRVELHLHPRELGPLQISLQVHDQQAHAQFVAVHADVRDAVQQALPQLRAALAQQGIALGEAMVGQQQQPSSQGGNAFSEHSPRGSRMGDTPAMEGVATPLAAARRAPLPLGVVDTWA